MNIVYKDKSIFSFHFLCIFSLLVLEGKCFNLDVENAYIIESNETGSAFGTSVALWHDTNGSKWIIIGAPLWKKTFTNQSLNEPSSKFPSGKLIVCDVEKHCEEILSIPVFNTEGELKASQLELENNFLSIGLGETLITSKFSNSLLVCAPRQLGLTEKNNTHSLSLRGACYLLEERYSEPQLLMPFEEDLVEWRGRKLPTPSANAGMGAYLSNDSTVVMGIPSMFYDSGAVCSYDLKQGEVDKKSLKCTREAPNSFTNSFYEGWSIVGGYFDGFKEYFAVSVPGQPKAIGKVVFYTNTFRRVPNFALIGEEMGARFGDNLAAGDFNGDGVTDLAVSSHLSSVTSRRTNDEEFNLVDAGKVYVYSSPLFHIGKAQSVSVLYGIKPNSSFGFALLCPGDLNNDGYQDLIVGAPYEGFGKIYVFSGSKAGIITSPSQIISHNDLYKSGMRIQKGFGFSLGGGIDIDSNGFPDIMVGAPISNSAILLRSAPVLKLDIKASFNELGVISLGENRCNITLPDFSVASLTCFNLTLKIQYISEVFKEKMDVSIVIDLDTRKSSSRILFTTNERSFYLTRGINNAVNPPEPFNLLIYVQPAKPSLTEPIISKIKVNLVSKNRMAKDLNIPISSHKIESPYILPVLDVFSTKEVETSVRLQCESVDTCFTKPDLILHVEGKRNFIIGQKELLQLNFLLVAKDDPAFQIRLQGHMPTDFTLVRVSQNESSEVSCQPQESVRQNIKKIFCHISDYLSNNKEVRFALLFDHSPINVMSSIIEQKDVKKFLFSFLVESDTHDKNAIDNNVTWEAIPSVHGEVLLLSSSIPETVRVWTNDTIGIERSKGIFFNSFPTEETSKLNEIEYIGPDVKYRYVLVNTGISPILDAELVIYCPTHVDLYPMALFKEIRTFGSVICEQPPQKDFLNYYDEEVISEAVTSVESNSLNHRRKRNTMTAYIGNNFTDSNILNVFNEESSRTSTLHLNCDSVNCSSIKCKVGSLLNREEIVVEVNSVIIAAFFSMLHHRHFIVTTKVTVEAPSLNLKNSSLTSTAVLVGKHELNKAEMILQNWWIILIGIIAGCIIVLILSGILYKFGFFKRKRPQKARILKPEEPLEPLFVSENSLSLIPFSNPLKVDSEGS